MKKIKIILLIYVLLIVSCKENKLLSDHINVSNTNNESNDNQEIEIQKGQNNLNNNDSIFKNTNWSYDCNTSNYIAFTIDVAQLNSYEMNFGINMKIKKINEYEYELRYRSPPILPIPEGMDWKNYSENEVISKIKYKNNEMGLNWLGFYNIKTKKREYIKNPFTNKLEQGFIILKKCD